MKNQAMPVWVVTGGIATGKSTVVRLLCELVPGVVIFDADACVRDLLERGEIVEEVVRLFGEEVRESKGGLNRVVLRERVFGNLQDRRRLEGVLHPLVRQECLAMQGRAGQRGAALFVADIPLFFENGHEYGQNLTVVVGCTPETQIRRIQERNGHGRQLCEAILAAQLPIGEKLRRADVVLWNQGSLSALEHQVHDAIRTHLTMTENDSMTPPAPNEPVAPSVPPLIVLNEFREKPLAELHAMVEALPVRLPQGASRSSLVFELISFLAKEGADVVVEGVIEQAKENYAMLRDPKKSFRTAQDDIYLHGNLIRDYGLRVGQLVKVRVRAPRERDKYLSALEVLEVEGIPAADYQAPREFDKLTPMFPDERIVLEGPGDESVSVRVVDLVAPLGKGQRGLIVAPPRGGKTILLKQIAKAIRSNHPEIELVIVLLDERPEEVTDFEETVGAQVFSSTFDEPARRHAQVADLVIERAKRLVEQGKDVVLLLDSLTRLARGHNAAMQNGPIGTGGVSPAAMQKSRKFFGTARNIEGGGSLTILATALIETESRADDVVFEEFKGTGNMEIRLDRELAERRVFPAIHIPQSGTRNDDRLYHPDEMVKVLDLRRQLAQLPVGDAIMILRKNLSATQNNAELLLRGLR